MQIQLWEGAVLSRAETVLQGTTHDTVRAEIGYGEKVSRRLWSKKLEEGIDWATRRSGTGRPEGCRVFELERVVSCRSADLWWRTKLDFSSGEPFDDLHRSTAFRAAPKTKRVFSGSNVLSSRRRSLSFIILFKSAAGRISISPHFNLEGEMSRDTRSHR
jgi:hypothetical protein